jgi:predicted nuclease with TOPRIM domain
MDSESTRPSAVDDAAGLRARLEQTAFDLELAREIQARLEADRAQLGQRIAALEADRAALRKRIDERQTYIEAINASAAWRLTQWIRGLFGRKW